MLGSSSSHSHHQEPPPPRTAEHHHHMRQLLLRCAQLISSSDFSAAHRLIFFLSSNSSPAGDSSDRLLYTFTKALSLRLHHHLPPQNTINTTATTTTHDPYNDANILQSSYLSLNEITPFIRFCHLTANQAILDAIDQSHNIHIIDFDSMHGLQWPPLMQAIADRHLPPTTMTMTLRITSTGTNADILRKTGERLSKFANSLGLMKFRFYPLLIPNENDVVDLIHHLSAVVLLPNETLAVNCVLYLHRILKNRDQLRLLLEKIKRMNPRVVTMAEIEGRHNYEAVFVSRFEEALKYYTAVFDSLEATLPPNSRERMEVEQVWFGREIAEVVAAEGERDERRNHGWMMRNGGFENVSLSPFAISQAKLLLRLHYPCEGYNLVVFDDCFCLGWRNQPLFSVSSWF